LGESLIFDGTKFSSSTPVTALNTAEKYVATIGNGTDSTYVITHSLGTRNVVVTVIDANSPYTFTEVEWEATTINSITLNFSGAVSEDSRIVTIHSVGSGELYTTTIGDGTNTEFEIDHNLGIFDTFAVVKNAASPYEVILCRYFPISIKKSKVVFNTPPSSNSITVSIFAPLTGYKYSTTVGDDTNVDFTIDHNLGTKNVHAFCRDKNSPYEHTLVGWRAASDNSIVISFEDAPSSSSKEIHVFSSIGGIVTLTNISELNNFNITTESSGEYLVYSGSEWQNKPRVSTTAPSSKYGSAGDKKGDMATDANYVYICYNNYVDNSTQIWRRVAVDTGW